MYCPYLLVSADVSFLFTCVSRCIVHIYLCQQMYRSYLLVSADVLPIFTCVSRCIVPIYLCQQMYCPNLLVSIALLSFIFSDNTMRRIRAVRKTMESPWVFTGYQNPLLYATIYMKHLLQCYNKQYDLIRVVIKVPKFNVFHRVFLVSRVLQDLNHVPYFACQGIC